ncbi:MAG: division/cell wall cluster transcriptional repressor MraZ [Thermoguttaceae bacterium]|nr:division/cell wall cluster transcriptional repressor MraZ [Thermoguttaceae bacterium]MDW8037512.1 division/cell wall cluster transcriptional repressor MraZ [Thermoguttaceae bacterium]
MSYPNQLILGEFQRTLDQRYRVVLPAELLEPLGKTEKYILAKERLGCLSLWNSDEWADSLQAGISLIQQKLKAGKLQGRIAQVQLLGRLLSTRHRQVQLDQRGRLVIPEGFREFLDVEAGGDILLIGAGLCVEIWKPAAWLQYLAGRMPKFRRLFDRLSE